MSGWEDLNISAVLIQLIRGSTKAGRVFVCFYCIFPLFKITACSEPRFLDPHLPVTPFLGHPDPCTEGAQVCRIYSLPIPFHGRGVTRAGKHHFGHAITTPPVSKHHKAGRGRMGTSCCNSLCRCLCMSNKRKDLAYRRCD